MYAKIVNMDLKLMAGRKRVTPPVHQRMGMPLVAALATVIIGLLVRVAVTEIGVVWTLMIGWLFGTAVSVIHIMLRSRSKRGRPSDR